MMEGRQHNNLWAEKLSQVSLPDSGTAWLAMEAILDKEMPTSWRRDRRRWLLLVLLLLLLIGVCNCPGRGRFSAVTTRWPKAFQTVPVGDKIARGPSPALTPGTPAPGMTPAPGTPAPGAHSPLAVNAPPAAGNVPPVDENVPRVAESTPRVAESTPRVAESTPRVAGSPSNVIRSATPAGATSPVVPGATTRYRYTHSAPFKRRRLHSGPKGTTDSTTTAPPNTGSPKLASPEADSSAQAVPKKKDSLATPVRKSVVKDSTHKKPLILPTPPTPPKKKPETTKDRGFMVGIGLNQFFTVGGQQASSWNSGGITGTLSDYIPVPMIRYYFNSRLYVQLEAQINTPQYTKKNLVVNEIPADSNSSATSVASSVSINKLFYFNLPLSVHYTIVKNLDLGTGLQYSQLTNGIGVFNSINPYSNGVTINNPITDSTISQTKSFKGDSFYRELKTHELRWLLDVNYTYHHFILGLRYNQALSKFIDVHLSAGQITQARNSSLQLYLRYILWDGRKKKPLLPPK